MRKSRRDPHGAQLRVVQKNADPATKCRGSSPDICGHVEDLPPHDANQFPLRMLELIVETAQHAPARSAVIVLHETNGQPRICERYLVKGLKEKTAVVPKDPWHDEAHSGQTRLPDFNAG